ncbi:MAG: hypothetical protein LiPW15_521 [Parcubacteria group bacterium LiPW_15]|nr:MAG: hypothetical protein LiPW15_521 [Parcubacteria group bacterium LiPW_15]
MKRIAPWLFSGSEKKPGRNERADQTELCPVYGEQLAPMGRLHNVAEMADPLKLGFWLWRGWAGR